jgi:putative membrane protein
MNLIIRWLITALAVLISSYILPGVAVQGIGTALLVALVLGLLSVLVKPLLVLLTLPITILTFGLFMFVINAVLILLTSAIVPGFSVRNFWWALLFSLVLSVVGSFLHMLDRTE